MHGSPCELLQMLSSKTLDPGRHFNQPIWKHIMGSQRYCLEEFPAAAGTNYRKLSGLKQWKFILLQLCSQRSEIGITGPKARCWQSRSLQRRSRRFCSVFSPALGGCWQSLACSHSAPVSAYGVTWPSLLHVTSSLASLL